MAGKHRRMPATATKNGLAPTVAYFALPFIVLVLIVVVDTL